MTEEEEASLASDDTDASDPQDTSEEQSEVAEALEAARCPRSWGDPRLRFTFTRMPAPFIIAAEGSCCDGRNPSPCAS